MENNLIEVAKKANGGNKESILEIIVRFTPLIKKYSKLLSYDGADTDLIIALIDTLYHLPISNNMKEDKEVVAYIKESIRNKYIRLSKKNSEINRMEIPLDERIYCIEPNSDCDTNILFGFLLDKLSYLQRHIITEIFKEDKTETAIAKELKITKQAVNRTKNRAIKKMRKELEEEMIQCRMN